MALALTSMGMLSSIGHDVVTACAALRAGLVRPSPVIGTEVLDLDSGQMVPVMGHPVRGVTEGFLFLGLWARMAERAIRDLLIYGRLPEPDQTGFWRTCELMVVTPTLEPARFPLLDEPVDSAFLKVDYAGTLLELTGLSIPPERVHVLPAGHVGVATALELATRLIEGNRAERCLIVAVDSYLEPDTLDWLASRHRLKHGGNPVGLMPGEAGTALLVEAPRAVEARRGHIDAWVQGIALADTGRPRDSKNAPRDGIVLADLLASLLPKSPYRGDVLSNADMGLARLVPLLVGTAPVVGWAFARACRYYRARGCAAFFLTGRAESLHRDLQRSGAAHAHFISHAQDGDKLTSRADPFFDAVACGDEQGALSIARHSAQLARPDREHPEDFLYVHLLMRRFFLGATDAEAASILANLEATVAEGSPSQRLEVCRALLAGDGETFHAAFLRLIDEHRAWYETGFQKGRIPEEVWATDGCLFIEGLALLRLARAARISIYEEYPLIPSLALAPPRVHHEAESWRTP